MGVDSQTSVQLCANSECGSHQHFLLKESCRMVVLEGSTDVCSLQQLAIIKTECQIRMTIKHVPDRACPTSLQKNFTRLCYRSEDYNILMNPAICVQE